MAEKKLVRLQKMLADCGVASRRKSEQLIEEGSVKVNGRVAHIGDKVDPMNDKVLVKGRKVSGRSKNKHYYIMLHKPRGYVTTMSDEMGRKCVAELVKDVPARIYPVGRLDRESEGLLLMTNDGEFANKVTHPAKHVYKVYRVTVRPEITEEQVTQMCSGMVIDGRKTAPCEVHVITKKEGRCVLEIVLREGRNPPNQENVRAAGPYRSAPEAHGYRPGQARHAPAGQMAGADTGRGKAPDRSA